MTELPINVQTLMQLLQLRGTEILRLTEDNAKLRAALQEIAEGGVFSFGLSFDPDGGDPVALKGEQRFVLLRDVKAIADRARAALEEGL